jgi:hypothetical protein
LLARGSYLSEEGDFYRMVESDYAQMKKEGEDEVKNEEEGIIEDKLILCLSCLIVPKFLNRKKELSKQIGQKCLAKGADGPPVDSGIGKK